MKLQRVLLLPLLFFGCSSQEDVTHLSSPKQDSSFVETRALPSQPDTLALPLTEESTFAPTDSLLSVMLEQARQHYVSALSAMQNGDSLRAAGQFEKAIKLLDELSEVPDIDSNREFNDLSKAIIEKYEQTIARIDTLSPQSSVFALREKLNQVTEKSDSGDTNGSRRVIAGTTVPLVTNHLVEQNIAFFQGRGREHMERWLALAGKYMPLVQGILREEKVPEEIAFLTMVESGMNPVARSWAKAVGMWQFVKGTGRLYGLRTSYWVDERRDIEKATRAAARHLKDLHADFGDWYLAMAAYNSGAGKVYRAIRRTGSTDFWELRRRLPRETRNYVPEYVAVTLIVMSPHEFGFEGIAPLPPIAFDTTSVSDCVDLQVLAQCAGTDVETMRDLNPELVQWCTPPASPRYVLRIPHGSGAIFRERYRDIPDDQKRDWIVHTIRKGETLGGIAQRYGIPQGIIQETNRSTRVKSLTVGKTIVIPVPKGSARYAALVASSARIEPARERVYRAPSRRKLSAGRVEQALKAYHEPIAPKDATKVVYLVKKGDTLGHVADWFGCRAADLRNWNDIPYGRPIRPDEEIAVWVPKNAAARYGAINDMSFGQKQKLFGARVAVAENEESSDGGKYYTVRRGDTLEDISRQFGVSVVMLKGLNHLATSRINAGQVLKIAAAPASSMTATAPTAAKADAAGVTTLRYLVRDGDTMWAIARKHRVAVADVMAWNNLTRKSKIHPGQELIIHQKLAPAEATR